MNDDRLTADLHDAFRAVTAELTYDRPAPRLRRTPAYAVPAAAGLVAAGVATAVLLPSLASAPPRDAAAPEVTTAPATTAPATTVVDTVSFAGKTFVARRDSRKQGALKARDVGTLPAGVVPVTISGATWWFGEEPSTGEPALFATLRTHSGGRTIMSVSGAGWTQEQLVAVFDGKHRVLLILE